MSQSDFLIRADKNNNRDQYTIIGTAQSAEYVATAVSYSFTISSLKQSNIRTWIDDFQIFVENAF